jgi:hypothetical protein
VAEAAVLAADEAVAAVQVPRLRVRRTIRTRR